MENMVMQVSSGGYSQGVGQVLVRPPLGARSHWVSEHATRCALMKKVATTAIWTGAIVFIVQDAVLKLSLLGWG